jgi:hypothetical protein
VSDELRHKIEEHIRAILLVGSAVCFALALLLRRANAEWDRLVTWDSER